MVLEDISSFFSTALLMISVARSYVTGRYSRLRRDVESEAGRASLSCAWTLTGLLLAAVLPALLWGSTSFPNPRGPAPALSLGAFCWRWLFPLFEEF